MAIIRQTFIRSRYVTDTSDEKWIIATTALLKDRLGWTTSVALEQKAISVNVHTLAGEFTTVNIMKMLLSPVRTTQQVTTDEF